MRHPIVLTLRQCCICKERVAFFNGWGVHCRELQGPGHRIYMSRNESRILAALLYPPEFWRSRAEIIEQLYPDADGGAEYANSSLSVSVYKIRVKIRKTTLKITCGHHRGMILHLPVVAHGVL